MRFLDKKKGSSIVGALIISILAGSIGAAVFNAAWTEVKMSHQHMDLQHAVTMAEAGLEEGVRAYISGDWSGWTLYGGSGYFKTMDGTSDGVYAGIGRSGVLKIYVYNSGISPVIAAEAAITTHGTGHTVKRQLLVEMAGGSLYDTGIVSRNSTTFKGGNVFMDSYNSDVSLTYTPTTNVNRGANGTVASLSVLADAVDTGNADIRGYIATGGGAPDLGPSGTLHDYDGSYSSNYKDWSRVTTDYYANLPDVDDPDTTSYTSMGAVTTTDSWPSGSYLVDSISLAGSEVLTLNGDVTLVVSGDISITGASASIQGNGGQVKIYIEGDMNISGNGFSNNTFKPENLLIFGTNDVDGDQTISLGGNAELYAAVYAPTANIEISGGGMSGNMFGSVIGYEVTLNGGASFHYDEALSAVDDDDNMTISSWRELKMLSEQLPFDTPSGITAAIIAALSL